MPSLRDPYSSVDPWEIDYRRKVSNLEIFLRLTFLAALIIALIVLGCISAI